MNYFEAKKELIKHYQGGHISKEELYSLIDGNEDKMIEKANEAKQKKINDYLAIRDELANMPKTKLPPGGSSEYHGFA